LDLANNFIIQRKINFAVWVNAFNKEDAKNKIRDIAGKFKDAIKPITDDWMMTTKDGLRPVFNVHFENEEFNEPQSYNRQWVVQYDYPIVFSSYYKYPADKVITSSYLGTNYADLLSTLFIKTKELGFLKYFKDVITPTDLSRLPGLYIALDSPTSNRDALTSAQEYDANLMFQVHDFLATREVALDNHLKNVVKVIDFILKYEDLEGRLELFQMLSVDYGVTQFEGSKPVFTTNITAVANFYTHLY